MITNTQVQMSIDKEECKMKNNTNNYVCAVCGRREIKLWRPYMGTAPLICATCAEKRQSLRVYRETVSLNDVEGNTIGKTNINFPLPKWKVNEDGAIPSPVRPHYEESRPMTKRLLVNLSDVAREYSSGAMDMIPAIPDENGFFWGITSAPKDSVEWWKNLPTR